MVEYGDYRKANSRQKWTQVVVFEGIPHDSPRTSKEGVELARFRHAGDAYAYASNLVKFFNDNVDNDYHSAWAVVVR